MRDFQEFIDKNIAVSFKTINEKWDFVDLCHKNGFMYLDESKNGRMWENKFLHHASEYFRDPITICCDTEMCLIGYEIVPASEFLQPQTTIEIFLAKQTVVCLKKQGGKVIARGVARCSKDDEFNFDYGAELAFNRMLESSKKYEFLKSLREAGKKITEAFSASISGISSVNSAIKSASEEQERLTKESLVKPNHIQGDVVDVVLPKIKTLKDGTKIIKQSRYKVGDVIVFKKKFIPAGYSRTATITECAGTNLFKFENIGWYGINRIKGKVIE